MSTTTTFTLRAIKIFQESWNNVKHETNAILTMPKTSKSFRSYHQNIQPSIRNTKSYMTITRYSRPCIYTSHLD